MAYPELRTLLGILFAVLELVGQQQWRTRLDTRSSRSPKHATPKLITGQDLHADPRFSASRVTEISTGRSQWNFPMSQPLGAPGQGRPLGARHGVHASISGPISTPPINNGFQPQFGGQRGPPPAGGRMPIPPMPGQQPPHQQSPQRPVMQAIPPYNGASSTPPIAEIPARQSPLPSAMSPPPPTAGAPRSRRQYAKNAAAYIAGDPTGPAPISGHGHSQSQQFFSPAQRDAAPQFFSPGQQQAQQPPSDPSGGANVMYGQVPQQQQQQQQPPQQPGASGFGDPMQGMANQFGQMGFGGQKPMQMVTTTNLINLPLNPAELMQLSPPDIRLPPNVSLRATLPRHCANTCFFSRHPSRRVRRAIQTRLTNVRRSTRSRRQTRFCKSPNCLLLSSSRRIVPSSQEM